MSNETNQPTGDSDKDLVAELQQELREMGRQLETAFRATVESERAKRIQADIAAGVRELSTQVQSAIDNVQKDPRVQEAEERGRKAIEQAREGKVAQEMQQLLVTGISQINVQLRKLIERIEADAKPSSTQNVPIDPQASTGETTKLDQ
jgi:heparin binding hemagglutinin HbhA